MSTVPIAAPLWPGQRLTRDEFLRRWEALPEVKRAELIGGLVYMASPVTADHAEYDMMLHGWLTVYAAVTPGCRAGCNRTWIMLDSAPQPDADLFLVPAKGGQSVMEGAYCKGAPELAIEVTSSTPGYDFGAKLALYQRAGVREYLTVALNPPRITWRAWTADGYVQIPPDADGILRSRVFPGLWLDVEAALANDSAKTLATLQRGIGSPEHTAFVRG